MKAMRLSWTDFQKNVHVNGLITGTRLELNFETMQGTMLMKAWDTDAEFLDPDIKGVKACPQAQITKDVISNTTKQAAAAFLESLWNDMADGTLPVNEPKPPTAYDFTDGTVIDQPTE